MPDPRFARFQRDPEALAWARGHVERLRDQFRDFESQARAKGDAEGASMWRKFANMLQMKLIGGRGCVITPFDERCPEMAALMDTSREVGSDDGS